MKIFLSSETSGDALTILRNIRIQVENRLQFVCKEGIDLEHTNNYGTEFEDIGIITMILGGPFKDVYKERRYISRKNKSADIRLKIDYDRFVSETPENQRLMYIKNILDSIDVVIARSKGDFQGEKLKEDIKKALDVTEEQIERFDPNRTFYKIRTQYLKWRKRLRR